MKTCRIFRNFKKSTLPKWCIRLYCTDPAMCKILITWYTYPNAAFVHGCWQKNVSMVTTLKVAHITVCTSAEINIIDRKTYKMHLQNVNKKCTINSEKWKFIPLFTEQWSQILKLMIILVLNLFKCTMASCFSKRNPLI